MRIGDTSRHSAFARAMWPGSVAPAPAVSAMRRGRGYGLQVAIGCGGYKRSKRVATDEIAQAFWFVFFKSFLASYMGSSSVCICSQRTLDSSNAMHSDLALGDQRAGKHLLLAVSDRSKRAHCTRPVHSEELLWDRAR